MGLDRSLVGSGKNFGFWTNVGKAIPVSEAKFTFKLTLLGDSLGLDKRFGPDSGMEEFTDSGSKLEAISAWQLSTDKSWHGGKTKHSKSDGADVNSEQDFEAVIVSI